MSTHHESGDSSTVLVVEDDRDLADTYSVWLEPEYQVRTTYSGSDGLTWYDEDVDVVLLDRRIPDLSGVHVLQNMAQRDVDDQKAMLTAVEPGREIADMPCDEYLTKPVSKSQLRDTVRELLMRSRLDEDLQRHFTLTSKIAALERSDAAGTEAAITNLSRESDRVRARIEDRLDDVEDFESAFKVLE